MTVTDNAYIAVLENKLQQAERSIYEFKNIFRHWTTERETTVIVRGDDGLFPGQLAPLPADEETDLDPSEAGKSEQECIE